MNKQGIQYERTINSSYMIIPAHMEENLDVRIMLHRNLRGMIPVERCYMNEEEQYWYDISGKQALDSFVKIKTLEYSVFEMLILQICEQLEVLEWNLLDVNGLVIDPEFIFLNHRGEDISFIFYPQQEKDILKELQKLMEYLLSKLNHAERDLVKGAYELYELSLSDSCQMQDLKNVILKNRIGRRSEEPVELETVFSNDREKDGMSIEEQSTESGENRFLGKIEEKLSNIHKQLKDLLLSRHPKDEIPTVVYPEDIEEGEEIVYHPTVCIATSFGEPRGVLIYEGVGDYPDFELGKSSCLIGKDSRVNLQIQRETVSNFHAKIDYLEGYYLEDMNSTNGTFVNDELLNYRKKRMLNPGDVIRFADVKYRFL